MKKIFPNGVCEWPTEKHRRTSVTLHLVQCYRVLCRTDISFSVPPHEWGIVGNELPDVLTVVVISWRVEAYSQLPIYVVQDLK